MGVNENKQKTVGKNITHFLEEKEGKKQRVKHSTTPLGSTETPVIVKIITKVYLYSPSWKAGESSPRNNPFTHAIFASVFWVFLFFGVFFCLRLTRTEERGEGRGGYFLLLIGTFKKIT